MMKNKRSDISSISRTLKVSAVIAVVLSLVIGAAFYFALRVGFNSAIGHFDATPWFYTFSAGIAVAAVLALICAVKCRRYGFSVDDRPSIGEAAVRLACAALALFVFALFIKSVLGLHEYHTTIEKIAGILTAFIALAFVCSAFTGKGGKPVAAVMFILAALAVNFNIFADYFDFSVPVNSPIRNVTTILQCAALLFMITEARLYLPKESGRSTAVFASFVYLFAFAACFGLPIASLAFRATAADSTVPLPETGWLLLFLGISVIALFRFASISSNLCDLPEKEDKK